MWEGPDGKVLAINNERTIDDVRISIVRPYIRDWNLHIDRVRATDQGEYRCSVGPFDPITKIINLYVKGENPLNTIIMNVLQIKHFFIYLSSFQEWTTMASLAKI